MGTFSTEVEFSSLTTPKVISGEMSDIFIVKYSAEGEVLWTESPLCSGVPIPSDIEIVSDTEFLLTGGFTENVTFGSLPTLTSTYSSSFDVFVVRYKDNGSDATAEMAISEGGDAHEVAYSVKAIPNSGGDFVITGEFRGQANFGLPGSEETVYPNGGNAADIFIAWYKSDGSLEEIKTAGSIANDKAMDMDILPNHDVIIVGDYTLPAIFGDFG